MATAELWGKDLGPAEAQIVSMPRCAPPKLLQPLVTSAPVTVEFVADRVLLVIVLVIFFGRKELGGLHNLSDDGSQIY